MNRQCACCGGDAPSLRQWFNQDDGYAVCLRCFESITDKEGIEQALSHFGQPGTHHSLELQQMFYETVPDFRLLVNGLAAKIDRPALVVLVLWRLYARACEASDQSAVFSEFEQIETIAKEMWAHLKAEGAKV